MFIQIILTYNYTIHFEALNRLMKKAKREPKATPQQKKQLEISKQGQECLSALWALDPSIISSLSVSDPIFRKYNLLSIKEKTKINDLVRQEYVGKQRIESERAIWQMGLPTIRHIYTTNDLSAFDSYVFLSNDRKRNIIEYFHALIESVPHIQSVMSFDTYKKFINRDYNIYRTDAMKTKEIEAESIQMNLPTDFFSVLNKSFAKMGELRILDLKYPRLDKQSKQNILTLKYWFWQSEQLDLKTADFFAVEDIVKEMFTHIYPSQESILSVALVCKKFYRLVEHMHYDLPRSVSCKECGHNIFRRTISAKCFTCANHLPLMLECLDKILSTTPVLHLPESMYGLLDLLTLKDLAKMSFLNKFFYAKCQYITFRLDKGTNVKCFNAYCKSTLRKRDISIGNYSQEKCHMCVQKNMSQAN